MCTRAGGRAQANNETSAREDHRSNAGKWRDYPLEMEDSGKQQEQGHHGPTTAHVLRALLRHSRVTCSSMAASYGGGRRVRWRPSTCAPSMRTSLILWSMEQH
ncbi:hypothetical protein BHM03_00025736 [Ensete ventricosum]|uniref:Uncharacterized protein n=1 Tax=Ensete ventricosum TaxID=4639 RepID=A0A426ZAJ8_ENSVE|nr:hypothetical protein B296_00036841 [Ensete ventricosum]RZR96686.1 hypothetical protein BHM03_00025736 [Ensete ventricosum]